MSSKVSEDGDSFCQFHLGDEEEDDEVREARESSVDTNASSSNNSGGGGSNTNKALSRPTNIFNGLKTHNQHFRRDATTNSLPDKAVNKCSSSSKGLMSVPQIKCSSHTCGASAPSTPSNGQQLPSIWASNHTSGGGGRQMTQCRQGSIASIDERGVCCESASASVASSFLSPDDAISVNSVELASPAREGDYCHYQTSTSHSHPFRKRSKSRLSLNLIRGNNGHDSDRAPSPNGSTNSGRSPSLLPKFLRSSFSRLLSRDRKSSFASSSNNTPAVTPTNDHFHNNVSSSSFPKSASSALLRTVDLVGSIGGAASDLTAATTSDDGSPEVQGFIQDSPDTAEYFEQTKLDGLPVIPFAFPTSVVAERLKNKKSSANAKLSDPTPLGSLRVKQKTPSGDSSKSEPRDIVNKDGTAVTGRRHRPSGSIKDFDEYEHILGQEGGPKSLDHLESLAQQELLEEEGCGSYNIYEDGLNSLDKTSNNNNNNNNIKKRKETKMKPKRRLVREPSSEEGYVQMAPNVSSRNPSPSPTPSSLSPSSSSFSPSRRLRKRSEDCCSPILSPHAKCYLKPDKPNNKVELQVDSDEEHFMMDFSKNSVH